MLWETSLLGMSFKQGGCSSSSCRARVLLHLPQVRKQKILSFKFSSSAPFSWGPLQACQLSRGSRAKTGINWAILDYILKCGLKIYLETCPSCPLPLLTLVR